MSRCPRPLRHPAKPGRYQDRHRTILTMLTRRMSSDAPVGFGPDTLSAWRGSATKPNAPFQNTTNSCNQQICLRALR